MVDVSLAAEKAVTGAGANEGSKNMHELDRKRQLVDRGFDPNAYAKGIDTTNLSGKELFQKLQTARNATPRHELAAGGTYKVTGGDTVWDIGKEVAKDPAFKGLSSKNVSDLILKKNGLTENDAKHLKAGQDLKMPTADEARGLAKQLGRAPAAT